MGWDGALVNIHVDAFTSRRPAIPRPSLVVRIKAVHPPGCCWGSKVIPSCVHSMHARLSIDDAPTSGPGASDVAGRSVWWVALCMHAWLCVIELSVSSYPEYSFRFDWRFSEQAWHLDS